MQEIKFCRARVDTISICLTLKIVPFLLNYILSTVQGSVLYPVLYEIFVSPLFDLTQITNFADDNFVVVWNKQITALIVDLEKRLEMIVKWLKILA